MTVDINEITKDIENSNVTTVSDDDGDYNEETSTHENEEVPSTEEFEKNHTELMRTAKFEWQISKDYGNFEVNISVIKWFLRNKFLKYFIFLK